MQIIDGNKWRKTNNIISLNFNINIYQTYIVYDNNNR